jgi:hypothetical protein
MSCSLTDIIVFAELIYCGNILEDDSTLKSCGLKSGVMVHVLKKKEKGMCFYVCIQFNNLFLIEVA